MLGCVLSCAVVISGCSMLDVVLPSGDEATATRERVAVRDNVEQLKEIAALIGIRESATKTESDIVTDIKLAINDAEVKMPSPLPDSVVSEINKILSQDEKKLLREGQDAIKKAHGKKILYLPVDD